MKASTNIRPHPVHTQPTHRLPRQTLDVFEDFQVHQEESLRLNDLLHRPPLQERPQHVRCHTHTGTEGCGSEEKGLKT